MNEQPHTDFSDWRQTPESLPSIQRLRNPVVAELHAQHKARQDRLKAANLAFQHERATKLALPAPVVEIQSVEVLEVEPLAEWNLFQKAHVEITKATSHLPVRVEKIQAIVAKHFGITRADIIGPRRLARIVFPRQIAVYLARTLTKHGLPELGRRFGGRDHTTLLYSARKIAALIGDFNVRCGPSRHYHGLSVNEEVRATVEVLRAQILEASR